MRGQQLYQCFGRLKWRQWVQASSLKNSGWPATSHDLENLELLKNIRSQIHGGSRNFKADQAQHPQPHSQANGKTKIRLQLN